MEINDPETSCNSHVGGLNNLTNAKEISSMCDTRTDCNGVQLEGNESERKEESSEKFCEIDFVGQGLIDSQHKIQDFTNGTGENTPSPKSILKTPTLSVSPRSRKMVRFAFMALSKRDGNQTYSLSAEDNSEPLNDKRVSSLLSDKFNHLLSTTSRTDRVVASEETETTNLSVVSMSPLSHKLCTHQNGEAADSISVGNLVSDELESLVNIVRENRDESINSSSLCCLSKDRENKDLNQNTSDSPSHLDSKSNFNGESKFGSPPKTYSYPLQSSPPKSSFLISRGFPRIVLKDKSNKPQRVTKTVSPKKSWEGEEYHAKCVETTPKYKPKLTGSSNEELCSGESSLALQEQDRKCTPVFPCEEDTGLLKILEVSLEKIDENLLTKYGVDLKDLNHTKLNKCPDKEDGTSLENVNDELKENAVVEIQKAKRKKNVCISENISCVGKVVGDINNTELESPDNLEDSSSTEKICSDNVPKGIQISKLKKKGEKCDLMQEADTSLSIPMVNKENNNEASVSHTKPLSSSLLKTGVYKKCIRIHIAPLDPILLSKYGIDLESWKTTNSNVQFLDNSSEKEGLTVHQTMTRVNNKTSTNENSENNIRSSKTSLVLSDHIETEVCNLNKSDKDMLQPITQKKKNSKTPKNNNIILRNNPKKTRGSTGANSNDLKIVKTVVSKEIPSVNHFIPGDVETATRKIPRKNIRRSSEGFVNEHDSTPNIPLRDRSRCGFNLEHQNTVDNNEKHELNKVNYELTGRKMRNRANNKNLTIYVSKNNVGRSNEGIVSNDRSVKELDNSSEPDQDTLKNVSPEQKNSKMSEKLRESVGPNSHDLDIINIPVSNKPDDTTDSGDVGTVLSMITPGNVKTSSSDLVSGHKSTLKPVHFSSINEISQGKKSFSEECPLLTTSVHNVKVAMICLRRIDSDFSRYGIDKSELIASTCGKANIAKETNILNNEGCTVAKPNDLQSDSSTHKISSFNSSFKSKKRKRESANMVSTSSERHLRSIKKYKKE